MLRNKTLKFKQTYQNDNFRCSTPRQIPIYTYPFYTTKPALKIQTSFRAAQANRSSSKNLQSSPDKLSRQKCMLFTQRRTVKNNMEDSLGRQSRQSDTIKQLLKTEDSYSVNKPISDLKWKPAKGSSLLQRQPRAFLERLDKNSLFYCCKCYQYVFQVQKWRHYPTCKDQLFFVNCNREQVLSMSWQRLQKLKQLSIYSSKKERQIKDLIQQVKTHQFHRILLINYPPDANFFTFQQIEQAFVYTYQKLLQGRIFKSGADFFNFCL